MERSHGTILEAYYPEWHKKSERHCNETVLSDSDSIRQWGHAVSTYVPIMGRVLPGDYRTANLAVPGAGGGYGRESPPGGVLSEDEWVRTDQDCTTSQGDGRSTIGRDEVSAQHSGAGEQEVPQSGNGSNRQSTSANARSDVEPAQLAGRPSDETTAGREQRSTDGAEDASNNDGPLHDGQREQAGTRDQGKDESVDRPTQSIPKQVPAAPLPTRRFDDGVELVRDAVVVKVCEAAGPSGSGGGCGSLPTESGGSDDQIRAIRGRIYGSDESLAPTICGVQIGPINRPDPTIYVDCAENVQAAIQQRIEKKQKPCTMTKEDRQRLGKFLNTAMGIGEHKNNDRTVFSKEKVAKIMQDLAWLGNCRSKKWSDLRFHTAFEKLMRKHDPKFVLGAKVKVEPMAENKAPRLLIMDQDEGQICGLLCMHVMEECIFQKYEK